MDEEPNKVKQHIDDQRQRLGRNLDEIEDRVKSATDLKAQFDKNTGLILGAAVAGGFLLSLAFCKSSRSDNTPNREPDTTRVRNAGGASTSAVSRHLRRFSETVDDILDGLVGVASYKLQSFVADTVPGFRAQVDTIGRQRGRVYSAPNEAGLRNPNEVMR